MRYVVTGVQGMLGHDMAIALSSRNLLALARSELDITDIEQLRATLRPGDIVINCAAYNAVDQAEGDEVGAMRINADGPQNIAIVTRELNSRLVHVSTDYVFDGRASAPYIESTERNPISAYGRSKAAGEIAVQREHPSGSYIVRTAWLYGKNGNNFAQTMLNIARSKDSWGVVDDQRGQPTWTADLAAQIVRLVDSDAPSGVYHGTNSGETSWFGFAQAVLEEAGLDPSRIMPTDSSSFVRPAPRPHYSVLGHDRWAEVGLPSMRPWRQALGAAMRAGVFEI